MQKHYYLVLDVETANDTTDPLVYDLGFAVADRKGNIYEKQSFVVYDIYRRERELMGSCYYAHKIPEYEQDLKEGKTRMVSFSTAKKIIRRTIEKWGIEMVGAYNAHFDRNALNTTQRYITKSKYRWFMPYGVKWFCIWHMACQVICMQPTYQKWARKYGFISKAGNILTNAETVYKYITNNPDFEERHRGLDDVEIEVAIMAHCFRQKKAMNRYINRMCWRIPNTKEQKEKYKEAV